MTSQTIKTLALDWGRKWIGLAVGESSLNIRRLSDLRHDAQTLNQLKNIVDREKIELLVATHQADAKFVERAKHHLGLPIKLEDEELTTDEANRLSRSLMKHWSSAHSLSAVLILEQYFLKKERRQ